MKKADWAFNHARIHTMNAGNQTVTAVAVADGRILAVGDENQIAPYCDTSTDVYDMQQQTIIPAFLDPNGHFLEAGILSRHVDLSAPPLGTCTCLDDVFDRLRARVAETPDGEFVMAACFDQIRLRESRFPTCAELDALSCKHPIWVMHRSVHAGVGNSAALAFAEIDRDTPQPQGGWIEKEAKTGELTGLLEEPAAMGPIQEVFLGADGEHFRSALQRATADCFAHGVTTAQDAWVNADMLVKLATADARGDLGIRLVVLPDAALEPALANGQPSIRSSHFLRLGPRKLFADGSIQIYTAYLKHPYHSAYRGDADYVGYPVYERQTLCDIIARLHTAGHQIHIHTNGDAAADDALFAFECALRNHPRSDHRHTLIHGQTLREDQLDTMQALGISVSFFSYHVYLWGDQHHDIFLCPERATRISPAKSAERRGIRFTIHNDTPVTPMRPFPLMSCAVNRITDSGFILGEAQRITPLAALRAHTIDAAWQVFLDGEVGSIEVGKRADFAVLDCDPLSVDVALLGNTRVVETICNGKTIYRAVD